MPNPPRCQILNTDDSEQYWDWGRWATSPETSPIFDGSDTSMSGQGIKTTHNSNGLKPAGQGGGCIEKGPFKDMKVNLGPLAAMGDTTPRKSLTLPCWGAYVLMSNSQKPALRRPRLQSTLHQARHLWLPNQP